MSLRQSLKLLVSALMVSASFGAAPAQAALPVDLGSFKLEFKTNAPSDDAEPKQTCLVNSVLTSDQTEIGMAMLSLVGDDTLECSLQMITTSTAATDRASVTNPTLGLTGTAIMVCDTNQLMDMDYSFGYKDVDSVRTMFMRYTDFEVSGMQNCSWIMSFNDAKKSSLVGGLSGPITSSISFDEVSSFFNVAMSISGKVTVTGGTGKFAGVSGTSNFNHSGAISMPSEVSLGGEPRVARNSPQPFAAEEEEPPLMFEDMVLTSSKGGAVKIVSPPLASPTERIFGVVGGKSHKIRLVTSPGATCNVSAKMGTKTIKLTPKPLVTKTGVLSTSFTAASVAGKFGYKKAAAYKNKKGQLTAVCNAGVKKKNISTSVAFTFANS